MATIPTSAQLLIRAIFMPHAVVSHVLLLPLLHRAVGDNKPLVLLRDKHEALGTVVLIT